MYANSIPPVSLRYGSGMPIVSKQYEESIKSICRSYESHIRGKIAARKASEKVIAGVLPSARPG
jgi:hypothetical protein